MPQKSQVDTEDAVTILTKYIDFFKTSEFPEYSAAVWKHLAKETEGTWNHLCWWVNVTGNRRRILSKAREKMGIIITEVTKEVDENEAECEEEKTWFRLVLCKEVWNSIKPSKMPQNDSKPIYRSLRRRRRTNVIADEFSKQHSLPCAFSFDRNQVNVSKSPSYLKIEGHCRATSCNNVFLGYLDKEPLSDDEEIIIRVQARDTSREVHEDVRRYLNGEKREQLGKESQDEGCSNVLKRLKKENLGRGDVEGPTLPTADALRHAKHENVNRELGIKKTTENIVERIFQLQFEKNFTGSIHGLGYNPFYTFYGLPEQISLYLQYLRLMKDWSCISIDGTGSLVRKIVRMLGIKSGHIFLHCVVIRCAKEIVSVFQMLAESQEAETFIFWLGIFVQLVQQKPKQCITDYARALLIGCSKAFNNVTIKEYQNLIFLAISTGDLSLFKHISTFIRVDVAHLIKMICRWTATKNIQRLAVLDFCVRCVALMVDCQYLEEFTEIFSLTCIVLFQDHEDTTISFKGKIITVLEARRKLENYMSKRPINITDYTKAAEDDDDMEDEDKIIVFEVDDEMNGTSNLEIFITTLVAATQSVILEGSEPNAFKVLAFHEQLIKLAVEFLLWTAVGLPFIVEHGSSCGSEKNFQDLKGKVLAKYSKHIGIDKLQRIHMNDLIGATRSMASTLTQFKVNKCEVPDRKYKTFVKLPNNATDFIETASTLNKSYNEEERKDFELHNDSDLLSRENWRGKVTPGVFHQCHEDASTDKETSIDRVHANVTEIQSDELPTYFLCEHCDNIFTSDDFDAHSC